MSILHVFHYSKGLHSSACRLACAALLVACSVFTLSKNRQIAEEQVSNTNTPGAPHSQSQTHHTALAHSVPVPSAVHVAARRVYISRKNISCLARLHPTYIVPHPLVCRRLHSRKFTKQIRQFIQLDKHAKGMQNCKVTLGGV
jgi:hypothetical protein